MRPGIYAVLLLGVFATQAVAQPGRPFDMRPFEKVDQLRKVRMIEVLGLKEEQSVRFFTRLNEFEKHRKELMQSKHEGLDRLEQLVNDNGDEREIEKAFPSLLNIEAQVASERAKFFNSLSDILTVGQRAKLLTFERTFERELREAVRETQKRRMRSDEP